MEEWFDVIGYEGLYRINIRGEIVNKKGYILKPRIKNSGYYYVCLSKNGEFKYPHIHRLVAINFCENPNNYPIINHKDCNKLNNYYENLEWCTHKHNNQHARENILFKKSNKVGINSKASYQIAQIYENEVVYVWDTVKSIARQYNVVEGAILRAVKNNTKSLNYNWKRITKEEYFSSKDRNKEIPPSIVDKRYRDLSKAQSIKLDKLKSISKEYLIEQGVKCFIQYGSVIRKYYDKYAQDNHILTYIPVSKRFGGFDNFKKQVHDSVSTQLLNKIHLPI